MTDNSFETKHDPIVRVPDDTWSTIPQGWQVLTTTQYGIGDPWTQRTVDIFQKAGWYTRVIRVHCSIVPKHRDGGGWATEPCRQVGGTCWAVIGTCRTCFGNSPVCKTCTQDGVDNAYVKIYRVD